MRISDWSSDVCSSDLAPVLRRLALAMIDHRHARPAPAAERGGGPGVQSVPAALVAEAQAEVGVLARLQIVRRILGHERHRAAEGIGAIEQIGRASCRERVCQYV